MLRKTRCGFGASSKKVLGPWSFDLYKSLAFSDIYTGDSYHSYHPVPASYHLGGTGFFVRNQWFTGDVAEFPIGFPQTKKFFCETKR